VWREGVHPESVERVRHCLEEYVHHHVHSRVASVSSFPGLRMGLCCTTLISSCIASFTTLASTISSSSLLCKTRRTYLLIILPPCLHWVSCCS
jgi:hypothetical protein